MPSSPGTLCKRQNATPQDAEWSIRNSTAPPSDRTLELLAELLIELADGPQEDSEE
jgi:hypothetical protein